MKSGGWTTESKAWLYVVLTAHLPPGMPVGADVNERVTFAGYFLKVQGYHAAGAGPRDKPLGGPRCSSVAWSGRLPLGPASANPDSRWVQGLVTFMLLVGAVGTGDLAVYPPPKRGPGGRRAFLAISNRTVAKFRVGSQDAERGTINAETKQCRCPF